MFFKIIANLFSLLSRVKYGLLRRALVGQFKACGTNVFIDARNSHFSAPLISIGSDVYIGPGADFSALSKPIIIGSKVMFGPHVSIRTDNHNISCLGRFMYDVHERRPEDEEEIVIEDDVWIGTRVIILKGVRVGRGCVIAAGTILTRSVPPYSIVGGVPGKVIRQRWTHDEILMHEKVLYPEGQRLAFASEEKASK